ncbi:MAG: peptidylprolyl isomerase [Chitinophagaceae bacterium]
MQYLKIWNLGCLLFLLLSCGTQKSQNPHVEIITELGNIEVELYPKKAPKPVAAFLHFVDSGFYEKSSFYRVLNNNNQPSDAAKTELIQGGIWNSKRKVSTTIPHESTAKTGILHENGTISLARLAVGSASTEFFICIGKQEGLDYGGDNNADKQGYAAFGKVVKGMNVVIKISEQEDSQQYFDNPIFIKNIRRL